jgi:DNA invertase Pin-like site-specific DNA recombinase
MEKNLINLRPKSGRGHTLEPKTRKVGFYLRVSTEEQAENPEGSIKNQEERLKLALKFKNSEGNFGELQGVYCDAGRSGKDMNRPELKRLLKAIEVGEINMVMVSELSRLSRSIKDFSQIWEFMQSYQCAFLSLRENFDTSTAAGEMMLYSIANFAQFERRQTSERVAAGFLSRALRGLWNGGVLPMGYEPDPNKRGSLRIVEEEAKVVRLGFQALLKEGSVSEAAKWLNQNGYTFDTPLRGGGFRVRSRHFTFDALHRVLSNPAYGGRRVIRTKDGKSQEVPAVWPAMVDPSIFDRAQKCLKAGRLQKVGRKSRYPYLLSTRIFCASCSTSLIGVSAYGKTTKVPYYAHGAQAKREQTLKIKGHRCEPFRVSGKRIEDRVWKEVLKLIESPTHREPLFQVVRALSGNKQGAKESEHRDIELAGIAEKLSGLARRITELPEGVPADAFYDEMKRLAENQKKLKAEIQESKKTM